MIELPLNLAIQENPLGILDIRSKLSVPTSFFRPYMESSAAHFDLCADPILPKRVRFSPVLQIYSDIPWSHSRVSPVQCEFLSDDEPVFPLQSRFQESLYSLRTEIAGEAALTYTEVLALIVVLLLLFFVVWFVVNKVLLLEIETEMQKQTTNAAPISTRRLQPSPNR
jgi:hypothetical protein